MLNALKEVWYLVVGVFIAVFVMLAVKYSYQEKINFHLETVEVSFSGVVTKSSRMPNHYDLLLVDVAKATPTDYDVRGTEDFYFCVIKDNKAEFVLSAFEYQLEIDDSISVISKPMRLINHTKKTIDEIKISGFFVSSFPNDLRKVHEL
jgi:hypothetical protein